MRALARSTQITGRLFSGAAGIGCRLSAVSAFETAGGFRVGTPNQGDCKAASADLLKTFDSMLGKA
jgi:hypothetical protein